MSTTTQNRMPAGVRTGGQFAATPRSEAVVRLADLSAEACDTVARDLLAQRTAIAGVLEDDESMLADVEADIASLNERRDRLAASVSAGREKLAALDAQIDAAGGREAVEEATEISRATVYRGPEHVDDVVTVPGYGTFFRVIDGRVIDQPYHLRIQVDRELTADEARHLAQLAGYEWRKTGGEPLPEPFQDAPNSIVVYADSTKGHAYRHLEEFARNLPQIVLDGSPMRTTDRSGPGTRGTRLVEALAAIGRVELYAAD